MADEITINGGDDRNVEISRNEDREEVFVDFEERDAKASGLVQRIEELEKEKRELVRENDDERERVKKLKEEIEGMGSDKTELEREIERSEAERKALESIAARGTDLEPEVSRLQHDLITSMSEGEEANNEVSELKRLVEDLKRSISEKGLKVEVLEKERELLLERLDKDAERVKEAKALMDSRVCELEKKHEALEGREGNKKGEKAEQEVKAKIEEKESEIRQLKKWVDDLDSVVVKNGLEMERMKKEREELEIVKNELEALMKKSERKGKEMENKMGQLLKELEASENMTSGLKERTKDAINGKAAVINRNVNGDGGMGLKLQWPVVAASTGAVAVAAVIYYLRCAKRR